MPKDKYDRGQYEVKEQEIKKAREDEKDFREKQDSREKPESKPPTR